MRFAEIWKKWYWRIVFYVFLILFILCSSGYIFMEKLLFMAPEKTPRIGNITLQSGNAVLDALWLHKKNSKGVILYSHGNGERLASIKPLLNKFFQHNYSIFAYDYAGYGASTGTPGEKQACLDIEAAYRYLTEKEKIPPDQIIVAGFSVGGGPGTYIATRYPVRGLTIVSSFASAIQVVLPFSMPFDRFPTAERLKQQSVPVLIFHGTKDRIIPFRNGKTIFEKASGRKKFVAIHGAGHNDIYDAMGKTFWDELDTFFPGNK